MPPPMQPAGVSGPGALSRRTDGGPAQALQNLPDAKYGENSQYQALQQAAPLSASPTGGSASPFDQGSLPPNPAANQVVPFSASSNRPNEPVTAGAALGPGPGPASLGISAPQVERQDMGVIGSSLPLFEMLSNLGDSLPSTRLFVNLLKAGGQ